MFNILLTIIQFNDETEIKDFQFLKNKIKVKSSEIMRTMNINLSVTV